MNPETLLPVLAELLAKSFAVLLLATLLVRVWRGANSAQRHFIWLAALCAIMVLPATRLVSPRWSIPIERGQPVSVPLPAGSLQPVVLEDAPALVIVPSVPPAPPARRAPVPWREIVLGLWLAGAGLILGYRLFGSWRLHRLGLRSSALDDPRLRLLFNCTLSELGLRRRPEIRLSEECRVPVTWGFLRPIMLLPREALEWSDTWLTAALRHEAAHILRGDSLTRWATWIACAVYWPNPFIWLAAHSLRIAQEQAADDLVLRHGTPPEEYAAQLVDVARTVATRGLFLGHAVAMACPSTLEGRILAIVDGHRDRRPLSRGASILGVFTVLATFGVCAVAQVQTAEQKDATAEKIPPQAATPSDRSAAQPEAARDAEEAAARIVIPKIEFRDATIQEAVEFLRVKTLELSAPGKAIDIVLAEPPGGKDRRVTIALRNVPLTEAARYLSSLVDLPVKFAPGVITIGTLGDGSAKPSAGEKPLALEDSLAGKKALGIVLARVAFREATIQEAVELLRVKAKEVDPEHSGVNIVLKLPDAPPADRSRINPVDARITLDLTAIPLAEALRYVAGLSELQLVVTPNALVLQPIPAGEARPPSDPPLALPLDPPPAPPGVQAAPAPTTVLSVDKSGGVKWDGEAVSADTLQKKLQEFKAARPGASIVIRGDAEAPYKTVMDVLEKLEHAGVTNVGPVHPPAGATINGFNTLTQPDGAKASAGTVNTLINGTTLTFGAGDITFTTPPPPPATGLITKEWKVEPDLIPPKPGGSGSPRMSARDWLVSRGVVFEGGATAVFIPATSRLLVRNTRAQLDVVDQIIEAAITPAQGTPKAQTGAAKPAEKPIGIEADSTRMDDGVAIAQGHVRMSWGQYKLTANAVRYDPATKTVHMTGQVEISNDLHLIQAEDVEITLLENGHISIRGPHKTLIRNPPAASDKGADSKSSPEQEKLRAARDSSTLVRAADEALKAQLKESIERLQGTSSPAALSGAVLELKAIRVEEKADQESARHLALHIPLKRAPGAKIDAKDMVVHVLFYDMIDGQEVKQTVAEVNSHWADPPANWVEREVEELVVDYRLPKAAAVTDRGETRKYYGYLVRVYYGGQLQGNTADQPRLLQQYPAPAQLPGGSPR